MNYVRIYDSIVERAKNRKLEDHEYYERHAALGKSVTTKCYQVRNWRPAIAIVKVDQGSRVPQDQCCVPRSLHDSVCDAKDWCEATAAKGGRANMG